MADIKVDGNQFEIFGVRRPYVMASSFCLLGYYQSGERSKARAWLDRLKAVGFDGPRVFGENQDWFVGTGRGYFGNPAHTTRVAVIGDETGGTSGTEPNGAYRAIVEELAADLRDRRMVAEFCAVATVKGRDESVTSHLLNGFARMLRTSFGDDTPFLHETVNEVLAHSEITPAEADRYGTRWRRSNLTEPSHHNYPGSTIGQSDGGTLSPGFDMAGFTHVNIHPPRGPKWAETNFSELAMNFAGKPIALNETVCVLSQKQWDDFVSPGIFGANQCTTDYARAVRYFKEARDTRLSFCAHYFEGMSTNPDLPLSAYEQELTKVLGGKLQPPVVIQGGHRHVITQAYKDILLREPDHDGLEHFNTSMKNGMSEVNLRKTLLKSAEFAERFLS